MIVICAGLFMNSQVSSSTRNESVAEKRNDWRFSGGGSRRRMKRRSAMKPMSNMRSASSMTSTSTRRGVHTCCLR